MSDVRVSDNGSFALIELLTDDAKNWYAENVEGAPSVPPRSLTIGAGPADDLLRRMAKSGLTVEKI